MSTRSKFPPLLTVEVKVAGKTLLVQQATYLMELQRSLLIMEATKQWEGRDAATPEEQALRYIETILYPSLKACTTGESVPTLEQFLGGIPSEDSERWIAAMGQTNPRWMPQVESSVDAEEELQKKEF